MAASASVRAITRHLGRAPSTISRELRRGGLTPRTYRAAAAHRQATAASRTPRRPRKLAVSRRLQAYVESRLAQRWSPEQIATRLKAEYPDNATMRVSHETIYTYLYVLPRGALKRELLRALRHRRTHRRSRRHTHDRRGVIPHMISIEKRPAAEHTRFTQETQIQVSFAHPHSPWERGTNGNTNGLIRQFFPQGTDFSTVSRREIKHVQALLNGRPRKALNWRTPSEAFHNVPVALGT